MIRSNRRKLTFVGLGLTVAAGLLTVALTGSGIALAEPSPSPTASGSAPTKQDREAARAKDRGELADALAKELGIDKAKVSAALDKVLAAREAQAKAERLAALKARLDAAVAEGKLTREQADAIYKAAEAGVLPGGGPGGRHFKRPGR